MDMFVEMCTDAMAVSSVITQGGIMLSLSGELALQMF